MWSLEYKTWIDLRNTLNVNSPWDFTGCSLIKMEQGFIVWISTVCLFIPKLRMFGFFSVICNYKQGHYNHLCTDLCVNMDLPFTWVNTRDWECLVIRSNIKLSEAENYLFKEDVIWQILQDTYFLMTILDESRYLSMEDTTADSSWPLPISSHHHCCSSSSWKWTSFW